MAPSHVIGPILDKLEKRLCRGVNPWAKYCEAVRTKSGRPIQWAQYNFYLWKQRSNKFNVLMATKGQTKFLRKSCNSVPQPANRIQLTIPLLRWCRIAMVMHEQFKLFAVYISCDTSTPPKTRGQMSQAIIEIASSNKPFWHLIGTISFAHYRGNPLALQYEIPGRKGETVEVPYPKATFSTL